MSNDIDRHSPKASTLATSRLIPLWLPPQFPRLARLIGFKMNPENDTYTVAIPWYEREHFEQLLELAADRTDFTPDYDAWRAKALVPIRSSGFA